MPCSKLTRWLWVYELVSIAVSAAIGAMLYFSGRASSVESITFIRSHGVLDAVLHIWLNNVSSFFLAATLIVLHPVAGVFAVAYTSVFLGELLASWLAGYCGTAHMVYGLVETQAYILLWVLAARTYYVQYGCGSLLCRWEATVRETKRLLVYALLVFLVLGVIEVYEVRILG